MGSKATIARDLPQSNKMKTRKNENHEIPFNIGMRQFVPQLIRSLDTFINVFGLICVIHARPIAWAMLRASDQ